MDLFTPEFKRLKARNPAPSFEDVIDLNDYEQLQNASSSKSSNSIFECVHKLQLKSSSCDQQILGLKPCSDWNVYQFDHYPGFTVIQNPFVDGYQRYWVSRCLQDVPSDRKNVTNLTTLGDLDSFNLWHNFVELKRKHLSKNEPLRKLRWTTLGYHYNWTTKQYSEEFKSEFPLDIQCLTQYLSNCLGFGPFKAEAAIVNYYHLDSTLAGHTDHSELDHNAPLFSISFGQTGVFMLGGLTKEERKPMSIFLQSGDICVMSEVCRLAYHAVPKILSPTECPNSLSCFHRKETLLLTDIDIRNGDGYKTNANSYADPCSENVPHYSGRNKSDELNSGFTVIQDNIEDYDPSSDCVIKDTLNAPESTDSDQAPNNSDGNLSIIDTLNANIADVMLNLDWNPFDVYLQSSRINLNVRQVFPLNCDSVLSSRPIIKKQRLDDENK